MECFKKGKRRNSLNLHNLSEIVKHAVGGMTEEMRERGRKKERR
jgi:hypothetical protein